MEKISLPPLYRRFEEVAQYYGLSLRQLSTRLHLSSPQVFYDIKSGKVQSISRKFLDAVKAYLPEINYLWLISGEGEMLLSQREISTEDKKKEPSDEALLVALNEISEQRKLTTKSQEQIDRLLGIIEGFQKSQ